VTDFHDFAHLHHFEAEDVFGHETHVLLGADLHLLLEFKILFLDVFNAGEQIFNQFDEVTILGMLKSRRPFINNSSSEVVGLPRLSLPA